MNRTHEGNKGKNQKQSQEKYAEIYDQISMYLTREELLTPGERIRFLELMEDGANG